MKINTVLWCGIEFNYITTNMCGIFGHIGFIDKSKAEYCINTLAHRGPDGFGLHHTNEITLGHRRLSILDLSESGRQPMSYANGRYFITYNGEIYNFLEIKNELKNHGYIFTSESDTEVILAAFDKWQENCLNKFNGMWAFAIWDTKKQELFIARDRFGKKPLFYVIAGKIFAFASEMKALAPLLSKIEVNEKIINTKDTAYEQAADSLIKGIRHFPAASFGIYKNGRLEIKKYWDTLDHHVEVPQSYEAQKEMFRNLFLDACRIRMRSDVPIGTALSGGLDSSSVISVVADIGKKGGERLADNWQNAFVASYPGAVIDETKYAKIVAGHLDIAFNPVKIDPKYFIKDYRIYITCSKKFIMPIRFLS